MATHSSILAWRILWTEEPDGLLSVESHRVRHNWSDLAYMHALEKEMATHSSILAWWIPGTEVPGGLPSMGSQIVRPNWTDLAAAAATRSILKSCLCPAGIFSVLSLASECTTLAAELPKVSYVKALDVWLIACLLFGFASLVEYAVVQVMLNNPKRVEAEKARIAKAEQAVGKGGNVAKKNTVNGASTPVHISTLQVRMTSDVGQWNAFCGCKGLVELIHTHFLLTDEKELSSIYFLEKNRTLSKSTIKLLDDFRGIQGCLNSFSMMFTIKCGGLAQTPDLPTVSHVAILHEWPGDIGSPCSWFNLPPLSHQVASHQCASQSTCQAGYFFIGCLAQRETMPMVWYMSSAGWVAGEELENHNLALLLGDRAKNSEQCLQIQVMISPLATGNVMG